MTNPFLELRALALSLNSREDVEAKLVDAVCIMSEINELYLDVAIERDSVLTRLEEKAGEARAVQNSCEEWVHTCQLKADANLAIPIGEFASKGLKLIPLEEYPEDERRTLHVMTELELLQHRLEHDLAALPALRDRLAALSARRLELQERLAAVRQRYGAILPKMQRMYEEALGFAKR
jgi:hypothetical protein